MYTTVSIKKEVAEYIDSAMVLSNGDFKTKNELIEKSVRSYIEFRKTGVWEWLENEKKSITPSKSKKRLTSRDFNIEDAFEDE